MKAIILLPFLFFFISVCAQQSDFKGKHPKIIIDGELYPSGDLTKINPDEVANIIVLKDSAAAAFSSGTKDGLILITTKKAARRHYWKYFCSQSSRYRRLITFPEKDSTVKYILNGKPLDKNFEARLADLNDLNLESILVIGRIELANKYNIHNKAHGVVITTTGPKLPSSQLPAETRHD